MISRGFFDHFMTFVSQLVGIGGHIARSIKTFEKGLHAIFPSPFSPLVPFALSALFVPSIFSLGPTDLAKEPHLEAHSARMRTSKSPFCKVGKPLLGGWGALFRGSGGLLLKKGKHPRASLAYAKIIHFWAECKCARNNPYIAGAYDLFLLRPICRRLRAKPA